ncbi:phosphate ABC transporter permease subunit PstC [Salininema proteolyticum]|uniref:Phosphate transport system permease protein n=1 Tax=Salininema proteolyticum TaxID=1607685 RepID=A0ABV8TXU3_9ACTN
MSAISPPTPDLEPRAKTRLADRSFKWLVLGAGLTVLVVLATILISTTLRAMPALRHEGLLDFLAGSRWAPNEQIFGTLSMLYGTLVTSLIGMVVAVPVSVGLALFISEVAPRKAKKGIVLIVDLLATVPSVVFGLVAVLVVAPKLTGLYTWWSDLVSPIPVLNTVFGDVTSGRTYFTAGIVLAIMVIPIITSMAREVFDTVPDIDKQAAYALGATRWEMIKGAVLPHSFGGLVGASMLGLGRAMGETIAVTLIVGGAFHISGNMFASGNSMAAVIAQQWGESTGLHTDALIGIGVVLFATTVLVNIVARVIVRRAEAKFKGAQ